MIAFTEVVALSLFLSAFDGFHWTALLTGVLAVLAATLGAWLLVGAPRPPSPDRASLHLATRSKPVIALAAATAGALAYVVALVLGTPPNGWDQLNYHLPRAALWLEQRSVGYVEHAYDERVNLYPPNAEIGVAILLAIGRNEVLAASIQLVAALVCSLGAFSLARHARLSVAEAAFGALLFPVLPIVLLKSSTPKNDLVVASFLMVAAVFLLGRARHSLALAVLAVALAVGTKVTALYGVALLVALAGVAEPRAHRLARIGAVLAGTLLGSFWYAVNMIETGMLLGDTSGIPGLTAPLRLRENVVQAVGLAADTLDLSGAKGFDLLLYAIVAGVLGAILMVGRPRSARDALVAGALVASPLLVWLIATQAARPLLVWVHEALGEPQAYIPSDGDPNASPTVASDTASWYGPAGFILIVATALSAVVLVRRRQLPRLALALAGAPVLTYALVSLSLTYHPWQGRFFAFPVALSASLWGLVLRVRPVAWGIVALAATTAALSLLHYAEKPSGLRLLERVPNQSAWSMDRSRVQSLHDPALEPLFRFLDTRVPPSASLALALGVNDFGYPAFGPRLERRIVLVPFGSSAAEIETDWLYANGARSTEVDRDCWAPAFASERGTVFRRTPETCGA